jgi:hypothetical protein
MYTKQETFSYLGVMGLLGASGLYKFCYAYTIYREQEKAKGR